MRNYLSFIVILLIFSASAQKKYTVSGNIKDHNDGEDLIGASITVKELKGVGATSNIYGFYSLTLPQGKYTIVYSFVGYADIEEKISLQKI